MLNLRHEKTSPSMLIWMGSHSPISTQGSRLVVVEQQGNVRAGSERCKVSHPACPRRSSFFMVLKRLLVRICICRHHSHLSFREVAAAAWAITTRTARHAWPETELAGQMQ